MSYVMNDAVVYNKCDVTLKEIALTDVLEFFCISIYNNDNYQKIINLIYCKKYEISQSHWTHSLN